MFVERFLVLYITFGFIFIVIQRNTKEELFWEKVYTSLDKFFKNVYIWGRPAEKPLADIKKKKPVKKKKIPKKQESFEQLNLFEGETNQTKKR